MLLVGVLDKVGTFGMLRYCLPLFPDASQYFAPLVLALAVIGIFYGALLAIGQSDMKRLIAYTSVCALRLHRARHLRVHHPGRHRRDALHGQPRPLDRRAVPDRRLPDRRRGTALIGDYGGVEKVAPVLAGAFLIAGLSRWRCRACRRSSASSWCWSALHALPALAIVATVGIVLAALYIL